MSSALALGDADELVAEYLVYRGFAETHDMFRAQLRDDRTGAFSSDKIVDNLLHYITTGNDAGLLSLWSFLEDRVFSRLDPQYSPAVRRLGISLQRLFVVHAIKAGAKDKVTTFLAARAASTYDGALPEDLRWRNWYALPHIPHPETDVEFSTFFDRAWSDALTVTLRNFLASVFAALPLPRALRVGLLRTQLEGVECELAGAKVVEQRLRNELAAVRQQVRALRAENERLTGLVTSGLATPHVSGLTGTRAPSPLDMHSPASPQAGGAGATGEGVSVGAIGAAVDAGLFDGSGGGEDEDRLHGAFALNATTDKGQDGVAQTRVSGTLFSGGEA